MPPPERPPPDERGALRAGADVRPVRAGARAGVRLRVEVPDGVRERVEVPVGVRAVEVALGVRVLEVELGVRVVEVALGVELAAGRPGSLADWPWLALGACRGAPENV